MTWSGTGDRRDLGQYPHGYMSVLLSSNVGVYMFGHDYGAILERPGVEFWCHFVWRFPSGPSILLWEAMSNGVRKMLPLTETIDFDWRGEVDLRDQNEVIDRRCVRDYNHAGSRLTAEPLSIGADGASRDPARSRSP